MYNYSECMYLQLVFLGIQCNSRVESSLAQSLDAIQVQLTNIENSIRTVPSLNLMISESMRNTPTITKVSEVYRRIGGSR